MYGGGSGCVVVFDLISKGHMFKTAEALGCVHEKDTLSST